VSVYFGFLRLCDCPEMKVIECFLAIKVDFAMHSPRNVVWLYSTGGSNYYSAAGGGLVFQGFI